MAIVLALLFANIALMATYAQNNARQAASEERANIALDLHDSLGHGLTILGAQLETADRLRGTQPEKFEAYVRRAASVARDLLDNVRETVAILHDDANVSHVPFRSLLDRIHRDFASAYDLRLSWNVTVSHEPPRRCERARRDIF
jgi:signal transduction histidine kinase